MNDGTDDNVSPITFADLLPEEARRPFTLTQSLTWAKRNCIPEAVNRIASRAVVARLVEEIEKLQALLKELDSDLESGYYISYRTTQHLDTYWEKLNKS